MERPTCQLLDMPLGLRGIRGFDASKLRHVKMKKCSSLYSLACWQKADGCSSKTFAKEPMEMNLQQDNFGRMTETQQVANGRES